MVLTATYMRLLFFILVYKTNFKLSCFLKYKMSYNLYYVKLDYVIMTLSILFQK